jgi:hypothetical protein
MAKEKTGESEKQEAALRWDKDKLRMDLLPVRPLFDIAAVYTMGAKKYADRNWEKGMSWSRMIGSMERHWFSFKGGEDFDDESGLYHLAHAAWNILGLLEYYRTHPELDDRGRDIFDDKQVADGRDDYM